ncbi:MAG: TetR/AcrR family transcriptional regulator [bacterium]|nr:TetR/AcrR family transcriptional regulator [bacterium]
MKTRPSMREIEPADSPLWREPSQERSRLRVEGILAAARQLIGEKGSEHLKMRETAERAGVPIGSLYQFFPDRTALLACLFSKHLGVVNRMLREKFEAVANAEQLQAAAEELVESIYRLLQEDPALVDIWTGIQASKAIRHLDLNDSRDTAQFMFDTVRRLLDPEIPDKRLWRACFLVCDLAGAASRTALGLPNEEGAELVREYSHMAGAYLSSILDA